MHLLRKIMIFLLGATSILSAAIFFIADPSPDHFVQVVAEGQQTPLGQITTRNTAIGAFKSEVAFNHKIKSDQGKAFYGYELSISGNDRLDRIAIGITNNLITRMETWNGNKLLEQQELGFVGKMSWGDDQTMSLAFYDQTNTRYPGRSHISLRLFSGRGFLGDIASLPVDLSAYGDLSGEKGIGIFARSLDAKPIAQPTFSNLKIWKNYASWD